MKFSPNDLFPDLPGFFGKRPWRTALLVLLLIVISGPGAVLGVFALAFLYVIAASLYRIANRGD